MKLRKNHLAPKFDGIFSLPDSLMSRIISLFSVCDVMLTNRLPSDLHDKNALNQLACDPNKNVLNIVQKLFLTLIIVWQKSSYIFDIKIRLTEID